MLWHLICTAILVKRRAGSAGSKLLARFTLATRGGFGVQLSALVDRFLRRNSPDRPILFDPSIPLVGEKLDGLEPNREGQYVLGHLARGRELVKLCDVWGLSPLPQS